MKLGYADWAVYFLMNEEILLERREDTIWRRIGNPQTRKEGQGSKSIEVPILFMNEGVLSNPFAYQIELLAPLKYPCMKHQRKAIYTLLSDNILRVKIYPSRCRHSLLTGQTRESCRQLRTTNCVLEFSWNWEDMKENLSQYLDSVEQFAACRETEY